MKQLVCIFLLLPCLVFSQSSFGNKKQDMQVVLTAASFEKGLYSDFDNFLKGKPFISGWKFDSLLYQIRDATFCKSDISWRNASYDDKDPFYPCNKSEADLKSMLGTSAKINLDSVWGFNDGHFIYCKIAGNFYPVVSIGGYAIINQYKSLKSSKLVNPEKAELYNNSPALDAQDYARKEFAKDLGYSTGHQSKTNRFLLSMETGSIVKFDDETLAAILKKDAELYQEYLNIKHNPEINNLYLYKYNQKYPFEY